MAYSKTNGNRIKECRKIANLTQEKLAELIQISPTYLSEIENEHKEASLSVIIAMADVFNVSVDYLLKNNDHLIDIRVTEWNDLFGDCNNYEKIILYELVKKTKDILREYKHLWGNK